MSVFHICTFVVYFYIGLNLQQHVYLIEASAPKKYMLILPYIRPEKDQSWQRVLGPWSQKEKYFFHPWFLVMQRPKQKQCGHCPAMNNQPHMVHRPEFIQFHWVILKLSIRSFTCSENWYDIYVKPLSVLYLCSPAFNTRR